MEATSRLEYAERQLVMIHSFFPRIDTKITTVFAIVTSQFAVAALNISVADLWHSYVAVPMILFIASTLGAAASLYQCAYPHLEGGRGSLVYFNEIAQRSIGDYTSEYLKVESERLLLDVVEQIWRNSEIVRVKYQHLKAATIIASLGTVPWIIVLFGTSINNGRLPVIAN